MATVNPVENTYIPAGQTNASWTIAWPAIANGGQGAAWEPGRAYRTASFAVTGTFGSGGSIALQGSNDGANWFALSPAALTAAGFFAALGANEHPQYIRPNVSAGDVTTALTVTAFLQA